LTESIIASVSYGPLDLRKGCVAGRKRRPEVTVMRGKGCARNVNNTYPPPKVNATFCNVCRRAFCPKAD